jgi:hypothetical protein
MQRPLLWPRLVSRFRKPSIIGPLTIGTVDFNVRDLIADHNLEANVEEFNASIHHLARRGCTFSSERNSWTCDGSIPPRAEMEDQIQRRGTVGTKVSAFYTRLGGRAGIDQAKAWVQANPAQIPCNPGAVFFTDIVNNKWYKAVGESLTIAGGASRQVSFNSFLSQIMAEKSRGRAWIFAPATEDFDKLDQNNVW